MNSYSNKKDFKVVDSLMQISLSIGSLYSKLADLEIGFSLPGGGHTR